MKRPRISEYVSCQECGQRLKRVTNTHLIFHGMTMEDYREKYPKAPIESKALATRRVNHLRGKTYEQVYGEKKGSMLVQSRKQSTEKQMEDPAQRELRTHIKHELKEERPYTSRKRAFAAYGTACMRCGEDRPSKLDVHHTLGNGYQGSMADQSVAALQVLCRRCHKKLHFETYQNKKLFFGNSKIQRGAYLILQGLKTAYGLDLEDKNFLGTPERVARAYMEICSGVNNTEDQVQEILDTAFPNEGYNEMIVVTKIRSYGVCPHHLLPIEYNTTVAYIPKPTGGVLGLSKLPRLVDVLSKRPVMQELLTVDIANALERIDVLGVGVHQTGIHFCMRMRGVRANESSTTTSALRGCFQLPKVRQEFLSLMSGKV